MGWMGEGLSPQKAGRGGWKYAQHCLDRAREDVTSAVATTSNGKENGDRLHFSV